MEPGIAVAAGLTPIDEPLVLSEFLPFRLAVTAQAVSDLIAATCEDRFGLSIPAWRMLCLLAERGRSTRYDLGVGAGLPASGTAEAAASLIARGLARADGPDSELAITATGRHVHADQAGLALAAQAALLAGLSPAEVRSLRQLLGRLEAAAHKLTPNG
jgi:DNA-binding MarR family transcriptional regulator